MESTLSLKGQLTLPKAAREHLKIGPGDRVKIFLHPDGTVVLMHKRPSTSIKGMFTGRVGKPVCRALRATALGPCASFRSVPKGPRRYLA